jgi:hypothetical protein
MVEIKNGKTFMLFLVSIAVFLLALNKHLPGLRSTEPAYGADLSERVEGVPPIARLERGLRYPQRDVR